MTYEAIKYINQTIENLVEYEFDVYRGKEQTYFVGELGSGELSNEDNHETTTFIINAVTYENHTKLLEGLEAIQNELHRKRKILDNGNLLYIMVNPYFKIPTEDMRIKKMQMNITVNEWRVM